jgi:hypothetical protein
MDSQPRTGKRCKNTYRYKKHTNLCHRVEQGTPIGSHNTRSYPRNGKRCKPTYRQNKSKKMCISKLVSPSPVTYESYERLGKRCKKSFRHHRPSGLCVYTKKRKSKTNNRKLRITREAPLQVDRLDELIESPNSLDNFESPNSLDNFESPLNSPDDEDVMYSPMSSPEPPVVPRPKKRSDLNLFQNMGINM